MKEEVRNIMVLSSSALKLLSTSFRTFLANAFYTIILGDKHRQMCVYVVCFFMVQLSNSILES